MRVSALSVVVCGGLAACTAVPRFQPGTEDNTSAIIAHIQCQLSEAYKALYPNHPWLFKWAVAYKLTYTADKTLTGTGGPIVWTIPVANIQAGVASRANENIRQGIVEYRNNFPLIPCTEDPNGAGPVLFSGDLGIQQWLTKSLGPSTGDAESRVPVTGVPTALSYQTSFVLTYDVSVKPGITLINLNIGAQAEDKKIDTNTLDLAFTAIPTPGGRNRRAGQPVIDEGTNQQLQDQLRELQFENLGISN